MPVLALLPQLALMLAAAPVLAGLTGTGGPSQPWRDLLRLFRKPGLWPEHAAFIGAVPVINLGAALFACILVPSFTLGMATAPIADLILILALFGLSRAALVLAGFDAEMGFASLSAQRAAIVRAAAEPGLLVLMLLVAAAFGSSNLDLAITASREAGWSWVLLLPAIASGMLFLSYASVPIDSAFAGRDLAILRFSGQLRRVVVLSVLAALLAPFGLAPAGSGVEAWVVGAACWAVKIAALGATAALLDRCRARLRADQAPELAALGLLLALIAAALFFAGQRAA